MNAKKKVFIKHAISFKAKDKSRYKNGVEKQHYRYNLCISSGPDAGLGTNKPIALKFGH